jgi:spermidine synthase
MLGTKILEERKSKFNGELRVVRTLGYGTYIQAGGLTQSGGIVESIWKSTLRKIPDSRFHNRNVLILGLGGGTVAKLIRKKWPETKITGVDIDSHMIEFGKKYLGLDKTNVKIKIFDALDFLTDHCSRSTVHFDLIIVDLYNGDEYPKKFETDNCIHLVRNNLSRCGVAVFNRLYYGDKRPQAVKFGNKLQKIFSKVEWVYPEANLMFLCRRQI